MSSVFQRDTSSLGTVIGVVVVIVAISGRLLFDWTWSNPGSFIPILIGVVAAVAAGWISFQKLRS